MGRIYLINKQFKGRETIPVDMEKAFLGIDESVYETTFRNAFSCLENDKDLARYIGYGKGNYIPSNVELKLNFYTPDRVSSRLREIALSKLTFEEKVALGLMV